jgi:error-prone DNA polymerase
VARTAETESGGAACEVLDETLVIWLRKLYARHRRVMLGVQGPVPPESAAVHTIANLLTDLSAELAGIGAQKEGFTLPHGRGDEVHHGGAGRDLRDLPDPHGPIDPLQVKPRDFR